MAKPYRPRIQMREQTSDSPSVKRRSNRAVNNLKSREGYIANPRDRSDTLYRKGTRKTTVVREGTSSNRYRKPVSKKRTTPRRKK